MDDPDVADYVDAPAWLALPRETEPNLTAASMVYRIDGFCSYERAGPITFAANVGSTMRGAG
jgi:hypothetical protein